MLNRCLAVLFAIVFLSPFAHSAGAAAEPAPKYIILLIGDGMGLSARTAAELAENPVPLPANIAYKPLTINTMPVSGFSRTWSANAAVTDSAAAGTAIACGRKTDQGVIGQLHDGKPVESILVQAQKAGWKTGLITTVSLDHATPAAFYAHAFGRGAVGMISEQLADSGVDFLGGGSLVGVPLDNPKFASQREAWLKRSGYRFIRSHDGLKQLVPGSGRAYACAPRLANDGSMPFAIDSVVSDFTLAELTKKALELLTNDRGLFLMVEGGKIDWAAHANDLGTLVRETAAFDKAVAAALEFQRRHPADTLVVVTGDHESGGLTFPGDHDKLNLTAATKQKMSMKAFSESIAPLSARRAPFKELLPLATDAFGLDKLSNTERAALEKAWRQTINSTPTAQAVCNKSLPVAVAAAKLVSARAGVNWSTNGHTGIPVVTTAAGAGAEKFAGFQDNTAIHNIISELISTHPRAKPAQ